MKTLIGTLGGVRSKSQMRQSRFPEAGPRTHDGDRAVAPIAKDHQTGDADCRPTSLSRGERKAGRRKSRSFAGVLRALARALDWAGGAAVSASGAGSRG